MPKRDLYLMRHASAAERAPVEDHERTLTAEGRREASAVGAHLARAGLEVVLCSTAARAVQTFEAIHAQLPSDPAVSFERALYLAPAQTLFDSVCMLDDDVCCALVIAHNPGISELAWSLARGSEVADAFDRGMRPASLAHFEVCALDWYRARPADVRARAFFSPRP